MDILLLLILVLEFFLFLRFYSTIGHRAIYHEWYAHIIDILAIISGSSIMSAAIFCEHHPELFNFVIPPLAIVGIFIVGSWQACIHAVKLFLRNRHNKNVSHS